jgi:hypothetical protein
LLPSLPSQSARSPPHPPLNLLSIGDNLQQWSDKLFILNIQESLSNCIANKVGEHWITCAISSWRRKRRVSFSSRSFPSLIIYHIVCKVQTPWFRIWPGKICVCHLLATSRSLINPFKSHAPVYRISPRLPHSALRPSPERGLLKRIALLVHLNTARPWACAHAGRRDGTLPALVPVVRRRLAGKPVNGAVLTVPG